MKKLVKQLPIPEVPLTTLDMLKGDELIVYHCESTGTGNTYAFLTKLTDKQYGFVNFGYSNSEPVFIQNSRRECIKLASHSRELYVFESMTEMIRNINNKTL